MSQRARRTAQTSTGDEAASRTAGPQADGEPLLVTVRVTPRAARNALSVVDGVVVARLTAPPVEGAANEALIALLAARLRLPKRAIQIMRGEAARTKTVAVMGVSADELMQRISG